jgi:cephalosporin hydroxylase
MKEKLIVEIGMKLDKSLIYYHDILISNGLKLDYSCITKDIYYTKDNLDSLTENQMKSACIRLRYCNSINAKLNLITNRKKKKV